MSLLKAGTAAISFRDIELLTGGRAGVYDVPCPVCGPHKRGASARRKVLRIWQNAPGFASYHCVRCPMSGFALAEGTVPKMDRNEIVRQKTEAEARDRADTARQLDKGRWLWRSARPPLGTPAARYLESRGLTLGIPATIRFSEPRKPDHHPAMVTAFGFPDEPAPGRLYIDDGAVAGVHLTLLKRDGSAKAEVEPDKITIGRCLGAPLVLAPVNDIGGLVIAEGIEDALSAHCATGLGAWAAGGASRLLALADMVPNYTECVTVMMDADQAGRRGSAELATRLMARGIEARLSALPDVRAAA
jgi:Toprim domain-containing protein